MINTSHLIKLEKFENERKIWLIASSIIIFISLLGIIFNWEQIQHYNVQWGIYALGVLTSIYWWWWTMRVIRYLIQYKQIEHQMLDEISAELKSIRLDVKKNRQRI